MSKSKVYVEHVTEARTYATIIGRIVRGERDQKVTTGHNGSE